jgi:hypothetical protein
MGPVTWRYPSASDHFNNAYKETRLTDFVDLLLASERCQEFITHCWHLMIERGKSALHGCLLVLSSHVKFRSTNLEFTFLSNPWNLIKTPCCTFMHKYISLELIFFSGIRIFCKAIKQRVLLTPTYQNQSILHYWSALQRNPSDAEVLSLAET